MEELAVTLAHLQIYDRLLDETAPELVVLSHLWESEWAVLAWLASQRGLPVFGLSQLTEAIRIRRLSRSEDMLRPVEALSRAYFNGLTDVQQEAFIAAGHGALEERFAGGGTDILIRYAFAPGRRSDHRAEARALLVGDDKRPIGVVYGHSWFDFPHVYGMRNFTDFVDWFRSTLAIIGAIDDVVWLLKPHPMEVWYGGFKMADMIGALPDHVRVLPHETDSLTAMRCADAVVTVHGTVALEAVAEGVPVISADASYFDDWDFCHVAQSRDAYADLLRQVGRLPAPTPRQRDEAAACAMGAFGASPPEVGALRVPCDSREARLYHEVSEMLMAEQTELDQEAAAIRAFVGQRECDSYQVWRMAEATTRTETPQRVVMRG